MAKKLSTCFSLREGTSCRFFSSSSKAWIATCFDLAYCRANVNVFLLTVRLISLNLNQSLASFVNRCDCFACQIQVGRRAAPRLIHTVWLHVAVGETSSTHQQRAAAAMHQYLLEYLQLSTQQFQCKIHV